MAAGDVTKALRIAVRHRVGDLQGVRWADAELDSFIDEAQGVLVHVLNDGALWASTKVVETLLVAGTSDYALPSDFVRDRYVEYKGVPAVRWDVRLTDVMRDSSVIVPSETTPFYQIHAGNISFKVGTVTQSGSDKFALWYVCKPPAVGDTVDPALPEGLHNLLLDYVVSRCYEQAGMFDVAERFAALFRQQVDHVNTRYANTEAADERPTDVKVKVK